MLKLKALLLTQGMHGMISQTEGLAKALSLNFAHHTVKLKSFWNIVPPKITPISENLLTEKIICDSKIVISLPNTHNDDDITNKSLEVPAIGSMLLTNNTKSHRDIFKTPKEAILFKNPRDCFNKCNILLNNESLIKKVSIAGHKKIISNKKFDYKTNLIALTERII